MAGHVGFEVALGRGLFSSVWTPTGGTSDALVVCGMSNEGSREAVRPGLCQRLQV